MREIKFDWKGEEVRLIPSFTLLSRIASELQATTGGAETTISLAQKCVSGGAEPVFMMIPLVHFLREGLRDRAPSIEEAWAHMIESPAEIISFRVAYIEAVMPSVDFGKKPEGSGQPQNRAGRRKAKSTTSSATTKSRA